MHQLPFSRRRFLATSATSLALPLGSSAILAAPSRGARQDVIRLAAVGVGGKGWSDINGAARHGQVVAFCDIDWGKNRRGGYTAAAQKWPEARQYRDFRRMIEQEHQNLDGVTISTPDHMHAPATMLAMQHGLAVYTQKPLTRTVFEARALAQKAKQAGLCTQMGNQHHSGSGYRTLVQIVQQGLLGKIHSAQTWSNRPIWAQGIKRPNGSDPVSPDVAWDLWLGVAPQRPYKKDVYHPFKWRGWFDFGAGALGDMGCHIIDPVVWSLGLAAPTSVAYEGPEPQKETFPSWEIIRYRFAGTKYTSGEQLELTWYDGGKRPSTAGSHLPAGDDLPSQGVLLVGEQGTLLCSHGGMPKLYPLQKFAQVDLPRVGGLDHYGVWINGIRTGEHPHSSFAYAGPLTETVLLGVIASRVGPGELSWDTATMTFPNSQKATALVRDQYRAGWEFEGL